MNPRCCGILPVRRCTCCASPPGIPKALPSLCEYSQSPAEERNRVMAQGTGIEWTESTWNPVTGCSKISPGCKYCYAERMADRLMAMGHSNYPNGLALTVQPHILELPLGGKKPLTMCV